MRKLLFSALALSGLFFASCDSDKCKDKNCGSNGTCNILTGACDCTTGYEADVNGACNTLIAQKFIDFNATATATLTNTGTRGILTNSPGFATGVRAGSTVGTIEVKKLGGFGCASGTNPNADYWVPMTVVGSDSLTFSNTTSCSYVCTGGGKYKVNTDKTKTLTITGKATYGTSSSDNFKWVINR